MKYFEIIFIWLKPQIRYTKLKEKVKMYNPIQIGICGFKI
jgi:hypothetical protein